MFEWIETEKTCAITMQYRTSSQHLRVDERVSCEQTVKIPAVTVRPFHHRRNAETAGQTLRPFVLHFNHLSAFIRTRCRTISCPFWPILPSWYDIVGPSHR